MGLEMGKNIYKWGMFGMFHCHALPKKNLRDWGMLHPSFSIRVWQPSREKPHFFQAKK
jgi:hypothetical protein